MTKANGSAGRQWAHRNDVGATGSDGNQCPKCNQYNSGISKQANHQWFDLPDPDPWQMGSENTWISKIKSTDLFHGWLRKITQGDLDSLTALPTTCVHHTFLTLLNINVEKFNLDILDRLPGCQSMRYIPSYAILYSLCLHHSFDSIVENDGGDINSAIQCRSNWRLPCSGYILWCP